MAVRGLITKRDWLCRGLDCEGTRAWVHGSKFVLRLSLIASCDLDFAAGTAKTSWSTPWCSSGEGSCPCGTRTGQVGIVLHAQLYADIR